VLETVYAGTAEAQAISILFRMLHKKEDLNHNNQETLHNIIDSRGRVAPEIGNCDVINKENLKLLLKTKDCTYFYNEIVIVDVHRTAISIE